ncbi:hypothetical protein GCM10017673_25440 [Streptosporangium violaceochromogenes]|nr:hypothetical protein GCM10017673_25440 [Streptosporangium violaceochromogenes]
MDRNEVTLVGRVPEVVRVRSLQSGITLGAWRVVVRRRRPGRGVRVDTISCVSFEPEVTVAAAEWLPDDMVEVVGSLRRRWWGGDGAKSSGCEVEVHSARRLERREGGPSGDGKGASAAISSGPVCSLLSAGPVAPGKSGKSGKGARGLSGP